jgi:hypothetical protein
MWAMVKQGRLWLLAREVVAEGSRGGYGWGLWCLRGEVAVTTRFGSGAKEGWRSLRMVAMIADAHILYEKRIYFSKETEK